MRYSISTFALALAFALPAVAQQGHQTPPEMFIQKLDTSGDGRVSMDEYLAPTRKAFGRMDRNGDGYIDRAEAQASYDEMQKRMQEMRKRYQQQGGGQYHR